MVRLTPSSDQLDAEDIPARREWSRLVAPLCLLGIVSLAMLPGGGIEGFLLRLLASFVFLVLAIVWGILARQWILVSVVVAAIVGVVGLNILLATLLRPRAIPNESWGVAHLRTINTAEITYKSSSGGRYGTMEDLISAHLLDDTFAGPRWGYEYSITLDATASSYTAEAVPASTKFGRYAYYSVPDAVVRYSTNASLAPAGQSGRSVQ
jgi:hypothetical protein